MGDSCSDKIKVEPKENLSLQFLVLHNKLVVVFGDSTLQLALISFHLAVVLKQLLVQTSPNIVAVLWKKGEICQASEVL